MEGGARKEEAIEGEPTIEGCDGEGRARAVRGVEEGDVEVGTGRVLDTKVEAGVGRRAECLRRSAGREKPCRLAASDVGGGGGGRR